MKRFIPLLASGLVVALALMAGAIALGPLPVPALLAGATSGSGPHIQGCPSALVDMPAIDDSTSAEIDHRLQASFPPGTPEAILVQTLEQEGFQLEAPCRRDPSIRRATYQQNDSDRLSVCAGVWARVYWKRDKAGHVVRAWGTVTYDCL